MILVTVKKRIVAVQLEVGDPAIVVRALVHIDKGPALIVVRPLVHIDKGRAFATQFHCLSFSVFSPSRCFLFSDWCVGRSLIN